MHSCSTLIHYTTLFRSRAAEASDPRAREISLLRQQWELRDRNIAVQRRPAFSVESLAQYQSDVPTSPFTDPRDRKSTRLNSSHLVISYAFYCLNIIYLY